jgi:hypothetical protein
VTFQFSDIRSEVPAFGKAVPVKKNGVLPQLSAEEGIYNGPPTAKDLDAIKKLTGQPSEVDDWVVWSFLAADNTIHLDFQAFSPSILERYAHTISGHSVILDHSWGSVGTAKGLIFESALYRANELPEDAPQYIANTRTSTELAIAEGGYYWILAKVAFRANTPVADGLADGSLNRCSIGAKVYDAFAYCPNCSADKKRYVGFWEVEEIRIEGKGDDAEIEKRYVCPHTALNEWHVFLNEIFGDEDNPPNWSDGMLIDGAILPVELSLCVQGAIGTARVIRS